jgi:hypothetical protein
MAAGDNRDAARISAEDVLRYLRPNGELEVSCSPLAIREVDRVVATLPRLVVEERLTRKHPGFRRYFDALPRILFFYGRGYSADDIANEMNFVATGFGVDTVLKLVAQTVAKRVGGR